MWVDCLNKSHYFLARIIRKLHSKGKLLIVLKQHTENLKNTTSV